MNYLSNYNGYLQVEGGVRVYNTKTGNVVFFPDTIIQDVKRELVISAPDELIEMGFVRVNDDEVLENKYEYTKSKYSYDTLNVMLVMTYKCNCACRYCFENLDKSFLDETDEQFSKVLDFIGKKYIKEKYEKLELHFFGGEPTLRIDRIRDAMSYFRDKNINVLPNIITNGTVMNYDIIEKLVSYGIESYQITIDGPKEMHDQRRPMKSGESGWDIIIDNIRLLSRKGASVSVRINIDKENVCLIKDVCDSLPKEFYDDKNASVYIAPIVGCLSGDSAIETLKERAYTLKKAWEIIAESSLPIDIVPPTYYPCPNDSEGSAFYIDLKGNIYNCGGFVGKYEKIERILNNYSRTFLERVNEVPKDKCFKCQFGPVCLGGCKFEEDAIGVDCQYTYLKDVYDTYYEKYAK